MKSPDSEFYIGNGDILQRELDYIIDIRIKKVEDNPMVIHTKQNAKIKLQLFM